MSRISFSACMQIVRTWAVSRGRFFWINICLAFAWLWLVRPLYDHSSVVPQLLRFSFRYALYLAIVTLPAVLYICGALLLSSARNRRLFAVAIATVCLCEIAVRCLGSGPTYAHSTCHYPMPYVMFTGKPNGRLSDAVPMVRKDADKSRDIRLNEFGFRIGQELARRKPPGEIRVFVLGGSAVFHGSPLSNTIPGHLEELLRKNGTTQARVYNLGVVSYVSGQELALLVHTLVDYSPDLVIVYDGCNDVAQPFHLDPRPGYPFNFAVAEEGLLRMHGAVTLRSCVYPVALRSRLLRLILHRSLDLTMVPIQEIRREVRFKSAEWETNIVRSYLSNLDKMCVLAEAFDFQLLLALQPTVHFKTTRSDAERAACGSAEFSEYVKRQYSKLRTAYRQRQDTALHAPRCHFVDMSDVFADYPEDAFWDFVHVDNPGNRHVARALHNHLRQVGILSRLSEGNSK